MIRHPLPQPALRHAFADRNYRSRAVNAGDMTLFPVNQPRTEYLPVNRIKSDNRVANQNIARREPRDGDTR